MIFLRRTKAFSLAVILTILSTNFLVNAQEEVPKKIARNDVSVKTIPIKLKKISKEERLAKERKLSNYYLERVGVNPLQTRSLSLNDAIKLALQNNNTIEIARDDVRIAELNLRSLLGSYDGVFTFTPTYTRNSTTGQNATNDLRVSSNFSQLIQRTGGNYQVFFNNNRTENAFAQAQATAGTASGSSTSALYSTSLGITVTQPIFRNFRIDNTRRQIRIQRKRIAQSDADFRRQTIDIISQVQRAYWDLVFAIRDQQNRVSNLNLTKENLRQVEARIKAGAAAPLQKAEVSTELANRESDVLTASQQVSIAENTLKRLIFKDATTSQWSESIIPTDKPVFSLDKISLDDAVKDAIKNRPELSRLRLEDEVNKIDINYFKNQTKPQIDLTGTFSLNGIAQAGADSNTTTFIPIISGDPATNADAFLLQQIRNLNGGLPTANQIPQVGIPPTPDFLTGGYTQSLQNIFRSDAPNFSVGATISFPLRNRTARANLAIAEIQKRRLESQTRSQEQLIITEVRNAVQAVETARQRVLTARRARENAEIQLEGERKLYGVGRSTTFLLFQRENALTNARNAEIRAETDYNKALANLQQATSTTFRVNNIVIDSPMTDK